MDIFLPNSAFLGNIEGFIKKYDATSSDSLNISFHNKWVSIHPVVLAMTACAGLTHKQKGKKINVDTNSVINTKSLPYLIRMGLFDILGVDINLKVEKHEESGKFIPLSQIQSSDDLNEFITNMIPLLHANPREAEPIKYVISELVRNVLEHSSSPVGAIVCAQYYKKSNRVSIGVADSGIGIQSSMMRHHYVPTDLDAIILALKLGITGATRRVGGTETNAGAGLFFTKSIAKTSRNHFFIYSGQGYFKLRKTPQNEKVRLFLDAKADLSTTSNSVAPWEGTLVGIDINADQTHTFAKLLKSIRKIYFKDLHERKKAIYKKPRFV